LSLPVVTGSGAPFPGRDLIEFTTFVVILVTLLAQGLTLPWVIRALGVRDDGSDERDEETMARYLIALAAVERLDGLASTGTATLELEAIQRVRGEYDGRLVYYSQQISLQFGASAASTQDASSGNSARAQAAQTDLSCTNEEALRREALAAERRMLLQLREQRGNCRRYPSAGSGVAGFRGVAAGRRMRRFVAPPFRLQRQA